ncbi:MAG: hypothetical protein B5M56_11115 [Desulfococcus sp. 4484_241]|nr:MAG: hypothetical protein B5M56_11115 [Desulfococcus sp. 4484_241]
MTEAIIENGMEGLESAISILINEAMKVERSRVLGAEPWQKSEDWESRRRQGLFGTGGELIKPHNEICKKMLLYQFDTGRKQN